MSQDKLRIAKYTYLDSNYVAQDLSLQKQRVLSYKEIALRAFKIQFLVLAIALLTLSLGCHRYEEECQEFIDKLQSKFDVRNIDVTGNHNLTKEDVLRFANVGIEGELNALSIDINAIQADIEQSPQVKRASVQVILPSSIKIELVERTPAAAWYNAGKYHIIDEHGFVLLSDVDFQVGKSNYLLVIGNRANKKFASLLQILVDNEIYHVLRAVQLVNDRRWNLLLKNGTIIKLPEENVLPALNALSNIKAQYTAISSFSIIDLRLAPEKIYGKP